MACSMKRKTWRNSCVFVQHPVQTFGSKWIPVQRDLTLFSKLKLGMLTHTYLRISFPEELSHHKYLLLEITDEFSEYKKTLKWQSPNSVTKASSFTDAR